MVHARPEWSSQRVLVAAGTAEPYRVAELACYLREAGAAVSALALPELVAIAGARVIQTGDDAPQVLDTAAQVHSNGPETPRSLSDHVAANGISCVVVVGLDEGAVSPAFAAELAHIAAAGASVVVCEPLGAGAVPFRVQDRGAQLPGLRVCAAPDSDLPRYASSNSHRTPTL